MNKQQVPDRKFEIIVRNRETIEKIATLLHIPSENILNISIHVDVHYAIVDLNDTHK